MITYEKIKEYFDKERWDISRVKKAVEIGVITPEEFKEITGTDYE
jgi:hypothetical protein